MNNLPTARVDDILVHPRDNDLIVATHGRSIWIADDITPLQQLRGGARRRTPMLFDVRPAVAYLNDRQSGQQIGGQKVFVGENPPRGAAINYYLKSAATRRRQDHHRRRHRPRDPHARRHQERRDQPRHVEPHGCPTRLRARRPTSRTRNVRGHAHGKRQVRQQARAGAAGRMAQGEIRRDRGPEIRVFASFPWRAGVPSRSAKVSLSRKESSRVRSVSTASAF